MAKILNAVYLISAILGIASLANSQGSLLQMSQELWIKLLNGGFSKTGKLDPLKVPVIKVDQSEGDTSYRIILRNVEISGLNQSTLESIHIARGRLKSNLSELEAGYVSYSDLRDLDSIRYRFHTLIKEPKAQNESFEAIVSATNQNNKFAVSPKEQESHFERLKQYDPFLMRIQADKMREQPAEKNHSPHRESKYGTFNMEGARVMSKEDTTRIVENIRYPADVQMIYAMSAVNAGLNQRNYDQRGSIEQSRPAFNQRNYDQREGYQHGKAGFNQGTSGSHYQGDRGSYRDSENKGYQSGRRSEQKYDDVETSASENVESRVRGHGQRAFPAYIGREQVQRDESKRLEKQPGYIDIVYADGYNNGSIKRFGNGRIESKEDAKVYGVKDMSKEILEGRRTITHNCTDGESLTKRNDAVKAAIQSRNLQNLTRYARDYQEQQGFFEEGMQLVYHYGAMDKSPVREKVGLGTRHKRAHRVNETDDDVMHVVLKIRVPELRIKSDYQLTGKVGKEMVRGNGRLRGNFSEVVGDFTIELKKVKDQDVLIVRAARSKLNSKKQDISLQGMDEQGPVKSILSHGLMAAEAVAAMLADDLATKALNEQTADAMIYKMYKNLPVN